MKNKMNPEEIKNTYNHMFKENVENLKKIEDISNMNYFEDPEIEGYPWWEQWKEDKARLEEEVLKFGEKYHESKLDEDYSLYSESRQKLDQLNRDIDDDVVKYKEAYKQRIQEALSDDIKDFNDTVSYNVELIDEEIKRKKDRATLLIQDKEKFRESYKGEDYDVFFSTKLTELYKKVNELEKDKKSLLDLKFEMDIDIDEISEKISMEREYEPTNPEPTNPEPTNPEPTNPEPTNPETTNPEPTKPKTRNSEPTKPGPTKPVATSTKPVPKPKVTKIMIDPLKNTISYQLKGKDEPIVKDGLNYTKDFYESEEIQKIIEQCQKDIGEDYNLEYITNVLDPNILTVLNQLGDKEDINKYVESIYNSENLPFDLEYDLRDIYESKVHYNNEKSNINKVANRVRKIDKNCVKRDGIVKRFGDKIKSMLSKTTRKRIVEKNKVYRQSKIDVANYYTEGARDRRADDNFNKMNETAKRLKEEEQAKANKIKAFKEQLAAKKEENGFYLDARDDNANKNYKKLEKTVKGPVEEPEGKEPFDN